MKEIPFAVLMGSNEVESNAFALKNLNTRENLQGLSFEALKDVIKIEKELRNR